LLEIDRSDRFFGTPDTQTRDFSKILSNKIADFLKFTDPERRIFQNPQQRDRGFFEILRSRPAVFLKFSVAQSRIFCPGRIRNITLRREKLWTITRSLTSGPGAMPIFFRNPEIPTHGFSKILRNSIADFLKSKDPDPWFFQNPQQPDHGFLVILRSRTLIFLKSSGTGPGFFGDRTRSPAGYRHMQ